MAQEAALMAMESQLVMNNASSTQRRPVRNTKLLLEDYIHFLGSRHSLDLTICQLNQIIRIHGFKKIHHAPKKVLVDAVNSLDLVNLSRSTLHSSVISAFAVLTVDDAIADLNELNWQECCVTSLEKLCSRSNNNNNSINNNLSLLFPTSSSDLHHSRLQIANHSLVTPKRKISGGGDETCCGGSRELISEAFRSGMRPAKMVPRRKRSGAHVPSGAVCALSAPVASVSLASSC
ncbi:hypothetical protein PIB30_100919 [Stylosanthes scabra]|uniref:DUF7787 domain-containing protein n=1 Tax=Stylosanthes scabra TaxID=79078 RepID=A0ABU6SXK2_9FABA|nr:hypothetical protein [Stylosanthes scabra]